MAAIDDQKTTTQRAIEQIVEATQPDAERTTGGVPTKILKILRLLRLAKLLRLGKIKKLMRTREEQFEELVDAWQVAQRTIKGQANH